MSLLVIPVFVVSIAFGVDTWRWRVILSAATGLAFWFMGPAWVAVPVTFIIGIGFKNSLDGMRGSSMPKI